MQKLLFFVFLAVGVNTTTAQQFVLTGTLPGKDGTLLYLSYQTGADTQAKDSCVVRNGQFRFTGSIQEPSSGSLYLAPDAGETWPKHAAGVILEPAAIHVSIPDGDFGKAVVTGSRTQAENETLERAYKQVNARWKVVLDTLTAVNKRSNFQYQELRDWVLVPYFEERKEIGLAFYEAHPASYITAMMLAVDGRELPTDSLQQFYNRFPEKLKQSSWSKGLREEMERRRIGVPGTKAADFTAMDINGSKLALADFKGKTILLDFWASWCVPCRKGMPHVKELYAKYRDKGLEVIAISDDDRDTAAWKKAVTMDKTGLFHHILRGYKATSAPDLHHGYGIISLPTKILIGPDGTIIGRYEPQDTEAEAKALDKTLADRMGG